MRRKVRLTAALVVAGVVGAGALALAAPAIAGIGPFAGPTAATGPGGGMEPGWHSDGTGPGERMEPGGGMGAGHGMGPGDGTCLLAGGTASGTLTDAQQRTVADTAEAAKLAGDLYQAFADEYPDAIFDRVAAAEDRQLSALRTLLERYGLADPTADLPAGEFATAAVRSDYDALLADGLAGLDAALGVAQQVEEEYLAGLERAVTDLAAPDLARVYEHLIAASEHHLTAFTTWSTR